MNIFNLTVSCPDGNKFKGEAFMLTVRGIEGDLAVLAGHTPFVTTLKSGECKIVLPDDSEKIGVVDGGLLTVGDNNVTLLSGSFEWKETQTNKSF